jgi:hypothetical protein
LIPHTFHSAKQAKPSNPAEVELDIALKGITKHERIMQLQADILRLEEEEH